MNSCDRYTSARTNKIDGKYFIGLLVAVILPLPIDFVARAQPSGHKESLNQITSEQSVIYVNPKSGDNAGGDGTRRLPVKTITHALTIAQPNTTIDLAAGTYSEASGETFPLTIDKKVTIRGSAGGRGHNVVIRGNGYFISPTGAGQNVAIAAVKEAGGIIGVTVTNPHSRGHGLWVESANPIVASNTFTGNGNTGVSVNGNSSPVIEDNLFYNNAGNGLLVYGTSQPEVTNNIFEKTGFGVSAVQDAAPRLIGNNFTGNRIGIILEGNSQATLRNNQIENSLETGLTAIARSRADLGTADEPGNNVFRGNKQLDIQNASSNPIIAVGTEINGNASGAIDFRGDLATAANSLPPASDRPLLDPLPPLPASPQVATTPRQADEFDSTGDLPTPPSVPLPPPATETDTEKRELVFNAPQPSSEPVPFPPQTASPSPLSSSPNREINSLSDVLGSSGSTNVKYRVLVETTSNSQQTKVRSLYPDAFATVYQGKSMLQVGAFSNPSKAESASRSLQQLGLNTHILE